MSDTNHTFFNMIWQIFKTYFGTYPVALSFFGFRAKLLLLRNDNAIYLLCVTFCFLPKYLRCWYISTIGKHHLDMEHTIASQTAIAILASAKDPRGVAASNVSSLSFWSVLTQCIAERSTRKIQGVL